MILAFDVGNTETTIGLFDGAKLAAHWRTITDASRTPDELAMLVDGLLRFQGTERKAITGTVIGSVVPALAGPLTEACAWLFGAPSLVVNGTSPLPITLDVEEPQTVGADRMINTLAASRLYSPTPSWWTSAPPPPRLHHRGRPLPRRDHRAGRPHRRREPDPAHRQAAGHGARRRPKHAIGRRTEECIRAGVMFGTADDVDGLVRRIKTEWPTRNVPKVVATGGLAEVVAKYSSEIGSPSRPYLQGLRTRQMARTRSAPARRASPH